VRGFECSERGIRGDAVFPRPLTQSEIASLRQDAISASTEMKALISQRRRRQTKAMTKLMAEVPESEAAE
jgi:hypothetical protein